MNAKDLYPGLVVAIQYNDGKYFPVKAEVVKVGGVAPSHGSNASHPKGHRVKILNGLHVGQVYGLVGKRIIGPWTETDEIAFQKKKAWLIEKEVEYATREAQKVARIESIDRVVHLLNNMGIYAIRSSGFDVRAKRSTQALEVYDPIELEELLQRYVAQNFMEITFKGDDGDS